MGKSFIVIGTGAIGSYVGGCLAAAGATVHFVGRKQSIKVLSEVGLRITDLDGFDVQVPPSALHLYESLADISVDVLSDPVSLPIILVCVKSGATDTVALDIERYCHANSTIVSLQNGVENVARLKAQAVSMQVLAGMVPYNVMLQSATHSHRATAGTLFIEQHAASGAFLNDFLDAGLATKLQQNMREVQWGKLLLNLNNPINALSNLPLKYQLEDRNYRRALALLQIEALKHLSNAGITPAKVGKVGPRLLPRLLCLPNWLFTRIAASMLKMDVKARSSMWVDLRNGRPTEIDDLCGAVMRLAKAHGSVAAKNARVVELVKAYEPGQNWPGDKLLKALVDV
jgi:2-dehydropantoate 2-reductase